MTTPHAEPPPAAALILTVMDQEELSYTLDIALTGNRAALKRIIQHDTALRAQLAAALKREAKANALLRTVRERGHLHMSESYLENAIDAHLATLGLTPPDERTAP